MFRLSTGTTPTAYLIQMRVERAKVLIANGSRPICDIPIAIGFCDQSHFSRVFRRATDLPPKSYTRMQA